MKNHTKDLEDLIWQGSQISASGKLFSHSELKTKLKALDQRWQKCQSMVHERLVALQSVRCDLTEKELKFLEVLSHLDKIRKNLHDEELSKNRTKECLEQFSKIFEVCCLNQ